MGNACCPAPIKITEKRKDPFTSKRPSVPVREVRLDAAEEDTGETSRIEFE